MVSLITDGPETYWCIKHYDRGSRISFVANKGITARKMKYKAKARDVTRTGTIMKTMVTVSYTHLDVYKRQDTIVPIEISNSMKIFEVMKIYLGINEKVVI